MRNAATHLALVLFGFLLVLFSVEGFVRFFPAGGESPARAVQADPLSDTSRFARADPYTSWYLKPGAEGVYRKSCFESTVKISSHGFRGDEVSWEKPTGVFRIVLLGDSMALGLEVNLEDTFAKRLERMLNESSSGPRYEVLDLGMWSFGTDQEYSSLLNYGLRYQPDLVLLAFMNNDVEDNSMDLRWLPGSTPKPYFLLGEDGNLRQLTTADLPPAKALPAPSVSPLHRALFTALGWLKAYQWVRTQVNDNPPLQSLFWKLSLTTQGPSGLIFQRDYPPTLDKAWDVTKALIQKTQQTASGAGAGFMLVSLASQEQLTAPTWKLLDVLTRQYDFEKPGAILKAFSQANGIQYLDLVPFFREYITSGKINGASLFLSCDGHWTAPGQQIAAEGIFKRLTESGSGLLSSPAP